MTEEQKLGYIDVMISKTARAMRKQMLLPKNMRKELWFSMNDYEIYERIKEELRELKEALDIFILPDSLPGRLKMDIEFRRKQIIKEAADVCNFLGFLIDNQGGEV